MKGVLKKSVCWGKNVVQSFLGCHCSLHAAGLTYFSMLALIPVLCCILVLAKVVHVDKIARDQINERIDAMITSVEQGQKQITAEEAERDPEKKKALKKQIAAEEFAKQAIGFAMLLWTVISSLGQVEVSFDEIWGIPKARPIWKKAYLYLFVATIMPVLAMLAMSMPILNVVKDVIVSTMGATWLTKWVSDGLVWFIDWWPFRMGISIGFASLAFGYFLWVMPNGKVSFRHAWYGGALTAVLFGAVLKLCAVAQVGIAKSSALYGSFAFLPIVLAWFYMSWQVILLGACMVKSFGETSKA